MIINRAHKILALLSAGAGVASGPVEASAFEGRINIAVVQGTQTNDLQYTVGPDHLRIEIIGSTWPNAIDIVERQSGALTLVYPHNRSFVRLKPAAQNASADTPGMRGMPGMPMPSRALPPGIGPQAGAGPGIPAVPGQPGWPSAPTGLPPGIGPQGASSLSGAPGPAPGMPAMPSLPAGLPPGVGPQAGGPPGMPAMPRMPMPSMMNQKLELTATGKTTNILGYTCQEFELKQRGETMEIWATDQLPPYQPYARNQPHRFGPNMIEQQWPGLVAARKLFPLLATLHYDAGAVRLRFEVTSVSADKIVEPSDDLFQPPSDYHEVQPLPF